MFIPVDYAEITMEYSIAGSARPSFTSLGIDISSGLADVQAFCDAVVASSFTTDWMSTLAAEVVMINFRCETGDGRLGETAFTEAGGFVGACAPPNVTYLIQKVTGLTGRHNQGRMYIPGVAEGDVTAGGFLTSGKRVDVQSAFNDCFAYLDGIDHRPVVLHATAGDGDPTPVVAFAVEDKVATQRRRLRS